MSLKEFYTATPRETVNVMQGYYKNQEAHDRLRWLQHESQVRSSWEQTRWQTLQLINIQLDRHKRIKLTDLVRFPWEDAQPKKMLTSKALQQFLN